MKPKTNNLLLPISIIVAGLLIGVLAAGAIIYTSKNSQSNTAAATSAPVIQELSFLPIVATDHIRGNIDAPVKIIDYSDLECPYCKRHHEMLLSFFSELDPNKVAWVYRHFPIPLLHKQAITESVASECVALQAGEEGFWSFIDTVYKETQSNDGLDLAHLDDYATSSGVTDLAAFKLCVKNEETLDHVKADTADAEKAGGNGTPYGIITSKKPINKKTRNAITEIMTKLGAPELLVFAKNGSAIGLSGALPIETYREIVDILSAYNN